MASPLRIHRYAPTSIARLSEQNVTAFIFTIPQSLLLICPEAVRDRILVGGFFLDGDGAAAPRYLHLRQRSALRIETFLSGRYRR